MARREPQQYLKIAEYLTEQIRLGHLKPGDFLPSEAELCEKFDTSRGPVRQAMATLRSAGKISSGRGRRSVVLGDFNAENFDATYSVYARFRDAGIPLTQKINWLARRPATAPVAESLNILEGDPIVYVNRVRAYGGHNRVLQEHYFPLEVGRHILDFDESDRSLHEALAAAGVDVDNVDRVLYIEPATPEEAEQLELDPGFPLMVSVQKLHDHNGEPVEYSVFKYRADRMQLSIATVRGSTSPLRISIMSPED